MSRYKGWRCVSVSMNGDRHFRNERYSEAITKCRTSYYYYYDSPGGQRSRYSFDRLRDAIASLEEQHENL